MFDAIAGLLAFFYDLVPSYAVAISLLTIVVMLVLFPLTLKQTRSMLAMQRAAPEIKRLQEKHKGDRQKLNEELMAFYKEHNINPLAGCLPLLLQMPVFIVLFRVIDGLSHSGGPKYIGESTELYQALKESGGRMVSLGIDLAKSASDAHGSFANALPFYVLVGLTIATSYYQQRQMTARNPQAAQVNPQQQMILKFMPAFFGLISLQFPAALVVYFVVSNLFRIAQQEVMYRWDPHLVAHAKAAATEVTAKAKPAEPKGNGSKRAEPKAAGRGYPPAKPTPPKGPKAQRGPKPRRKKSKRGR